MVTQLNQLFDLYRKSLSMVNPSTDEVFVCPLCLQVFGRDAIESRSLSIEHVPPSSIGASVTTLTCTQCNNTAGNCLQNQMEEYVRHKEFMGGRVPKRGMPARAEIGDSAWSFVITQIPGQGRMTGFSLGSHVSPKLWPTDLSLLVGKEAHVTLKLRYSSDIVNVAYLHSAYLALFHCMGYLYIMQRALNSVRDKIASFSTKGGIQHRLHVPGLHMDPRNSGIEIGMFWKTIDVSCLVVLVAGEVVLMPFMNDSYIDIFQMIQESLKKARDERQSDLRLGMARLLIDPEVKFSKGFTFKCAEPIDGATTLRLVPITSS